MEPISVHQKREEAQGAWDFIVELGEESNLIGFLVHLDEAYWVALTGGKHSPENLVRKTFEFLLHKEDRNSVLREFDLREVSAHFPDYEEEIRKKMHHSLQDSP
ncbi:hypothetical protein KKI17_03445 [Patescibacteria group bacterium]|nr:hypothetical protein [Patescibacteria group bacterium]